MSARDGREMQTDGRLFSTRNKELNCPQVQQCYWATERDETIYCACQETNQTGNCTLGTQQAVAKQRANKQSGGKVNQPEGTRAPSLKHSQFHNGGQSQVSTSVEQAAANCLLVPRLILSFISFSLSVQLCLAEERGSYESRCEIAVPRN